MTCEEATDIGRRIHRNALEPILPAVRRLAAAQLDAHYRKICPCGGYPEIQLTLRSPQ